MPKLKLINLTCFREGYGDTEEKGDRKDPGTVATQVRQEHGGSPLLTKEVPLGLINTDDFLLPESGFTPISRIYTVGVNPPRIR